jgi:hypothetical protein
MIEKLINLIRENAGELIINNQAIKNEYKEAVISETSNIIINELKKEVSKGNIIGLSGILKSHENLLNNKIVSGIITKLSESLSAKFEVNNSDAVHISQNLIPAVITQLISKAKDPNEPSFNVQELLSNLGGGGFVGMFKNFLS